MNERLNEYDRYMKDFKAADSDVRSLEVHCDRTLRRLFRDLPRSKFDVKRETETERGGGDSGSDGVNGKKGRKKTKGKETRRHFKQHRHVRVFGDHYVAANSNEHICRAVPAPVRGGIVNQYVWCSLFE